MYVCMYVGVLVYKAERIRDELHGGLLFGDLKCAYVCVCVCTYVCDVMFCRVSLKIDSIGTLFLAI